MNGPHSYRGADPERLSLEIVKAVGLPARAPDGVIEGLPGWHGVRSICPPSTGSLPMLAEVSVPGDGTRMTLFSVPGESGEAIGLIHQPATAIAVAFLIPTPYVIALAMATCVAWQGEHGDDVVLTTY